MHHVRYRSCLDSRVRSSTCSLFWLTERFGLIALSESQEYLQSASRVFGYRSSNIDIQNRNHLLLLLSIVVWVETGLGGRNHFPATFLSDVHSKKSILRTTYQVVMNRIKNGKEFSHAYEYPLLVLLLLYYFWWAYSSSSSSTNHTTRPARKKTNTSHVVPVPDPWCSRISLTGLCFSRSRCSGRSPSGPCVRCPPAPPERSGRKAGAEREREGRSRRGEAQGGGGGRGEGGITCGATSVRRKKKTRISTSIQHHLWLIYTASHPYITHKKKSAIDRSTYNKYLVVVKSAREAGTLSDHQHRTGEVGAGSTKTLAW